MYELWENDIAILYLLAYIERIAAIELGVKPSHIEMLETPSTTLEETQMFYQKYGDRVTLIVVTDAVHMWRAITFYKKQGIQPIAAPTNYLIKSDNNPFSLRWVPSVENFLLMDRVIREFMGTIKAKIYA